MIGYTFDSGCLENITFHEFWFSPRIHLQQYIGRTVHLRYRPEDMSEIYIYDGEGGKRLHTAKPVRKADNAKRKRRVNISCGEMDGGGADV